VAPKLIAETISAISRPWSVMRNHYFKEWRWSSNLTFFRLSICWAGRLNIFFI
jgi:hypothetical protein